MNLSTNRRTPILLLAMVLSSLFCRGARADIVKIPRSRGPLRLVATLHPDNAYAARALLQSPWGPALLSRGQHWREWKVVAIASGRVLLSRRGAAELEFLAFGRRDALEVAPRRRRGRTRWRGIEQRGPGRYRVSRRLIGDLIDDPSRYTRGLRILPSAKGGFVFRALAHDHPLSALSLRAGDRLVALNGRVLRSPTDALAAYGALRNASHFVLGISRGAQHHSVEIALD